MAHQERMSELLILSMSICFFSKKKKNPDEMGFHNLRQKERISWLCSDSCYRTEKNKLSQKNGQVPTFTYTHQEEKRKNYFGLFITYLNHSFNVQQHPNVNDFKIGQNYKKPTLIHLLYLNVVVGGTKGLKLCLSM